MFTGVSCSKKTPHHGLYSFPCLCYNPRMSTLCRAEWGWQKYGGAETSERPFFCPTHFSAFQKCRVKGCQKISDNRKYFGNISDLFFGERNRFIAPSCRAVAATRRWKQREGGPGRWAGRLAPRFRSRMCLAGRQTPSARRTRSQSIVPS